MSAKTHRERAEEAARKTWTRAGEPSGMTVEVIARLTFPTELVRAARLVGNLYEAAEFQAGRDASESNALRDLRAALALYDQEPEL